MNWKYHVLVIWKIEVHWILHIFQIWHISLWSSKTNKQNIKHKNKTTFISLTIDLIWKVFVNWEAAILWEGDRNFLHSNFLNFQSWETPLGVFLAVFGLCFYQIHWGMTKALCLFFQRKRYHRKQASTWLANSAAPAYDHLHFFLFLSFDSE